MAWVYLIAAGLFEVGWPIGLKWAQDPRKLIIRVGMAVGCPPSPQRQTTHPSASGGCSLSPR